MLEQLFKVHETVLCLQKFGAGYEIRTRDIQLGKLTLYQLS